MYQRTACLALLAGVVALAVALGLAYSHGQYTEHKQRTQWGHWRPETTFEQKSPTLEGSLGVATAPLIVAGLLLWCAIASVVASLVVRQPERLPEERVKPLEDHHQFLGTMAKCFVALLALSLGWLAWALYVLFRGRQEWRSRDWSTSETYVPEADAIIAPLLLVAVVLACLVLIWRSRARTRQALTQLKRLLPKPEAAP
jgi:hypothetical protein